MKTGAYQKRKYLICLLVCAAMLLQWTVPVYAQDNTYKLVKVGYYQADRFQEGDGKTVLRSGYSYEYLQKVASYTGWKYEYVSGDWETLYQKLEDGEIDLLAGVAYDKDRSEKILYPDYDMLQETFYIYKDSDDASMSSGDISSYSGKKIGVVDNSKMTGALDQWTHEYRAKIQVVAYQNLETCAQAFNNHEIDGFVSADNIVSGYAGISPVEMIGKVPYYLCAAKGQDELLTELNTALSLINGQDSVYLANLRNKYSADTSISIFLSKQEKQWMEQHPQIVVGYLNHYLPYSNTAGDGTAEGLLKDTLTDMFLKLPGTYQPDISYVSYENQEDMIEALKQNQVDLIFPVGGELPYAEKNGYQQSSAIIQAATDLVYTGTYDEEKIQKIAVNQNNTLQYEFTMSTYPDAELVVCDSVEDCIRAVKRGEANSTIIEALRAVKLVGEDDSLEKVPLSDTCNICFGVNYGNSDLLRVLNHGLSMLGDEYGLSHAYQYIGDIVTYGVDDFLRAYIWKILFLLVILGVCVLLIRYRTLRRRSEAESNYNRMLQDALMKAHQANYAKQVFLNNMSHDIRTPLNAILGILEINQKSSDMQRINENRKKAKASVNQLLTMMDHVIEMSQIESGGVEDLKENVDLDLLIQELAETMKHRAQEADIQLTHQTAGAEKPPVVWGNAIYIREILQYILENAVKYNRPNGTVCWNDEVKYLSEDAIEYRCTIQDTGIGMTKEFLQHIFEPFAQERYDARTTYKGSGLGMAIAKRLLDRMNGTIDIHSTAGEGTTVSIVIPFSVCMEAQRKAADVPEQSERSMDLSGMNILLAEDNELNIEVACFMLEEAGAAVTVAKDGTQAVKAYLDAASWTFDAVLMDIMMPAMNGYEATRAIRGSERADAKVIPVIATTACVSAEAKIESKAAGIDAFLEKPLDMQKLIRTLMHMVNNKKRSL